MKTVVNKKKKSVLIEFEGDLDWDRQEIKNLGETDDGFVYAVCTYDIKGNLAWVSIAIVDKSEVKK